MRRIFILFSIIILGGSLFTGLAGCDAIEESGLKDIIDNVTSGDSLSAGETDQNSHSTMQTEETGISLVEYFNGTMPFFYRQVTSGAVFCESGDCPDTLSVRNWMVNEECFFCESSSEIIGNKLIAHISAVTYADMMGSCTEKDTFSYPNELTITEQTPDRIVAEGTGNGYHEVVGDGCTTPNKYRYETYEKWIFTTEKLEDQSTVTVTTDAPGNVIVAPGWNNPQTPPIYSQQSMTVTCSSEPGFQVSPSIKVVRVNGYEASASIQMKEDKLSDTTFRYTFGAFYNAEYTVVGICRTYGKNGALLNEIVSDTEVTIKVTDAPQGDMPEDWYK